MRVLDERIVSISIEVNGQTRTYTGLELVATGTKYANANQNECEIKITNLDRQTSDYILTETSPYNLNRTPKRVTVNAGRVSYGTTRIFTGDVVSASFSQPPDTVVTLKCLTSNFSKGNIISRNQTGVAPLSKIAQNVASDVGLILNFQAQDKQISNYNFSGGALKQVEKLNDIGNINAFVDDGQLILKDINSSLRGASRLLNLDNGLIGIPEPTEFGVKVKYLLDRQTVLGGGLQLESVMYPALNGNYIIYKLNFEITSRDLPFYWIAEAKRKP